MRVIPLRRLLPQAPIVIFVIAVVPTQSGLAGDDRRDYRERQARLEHRYFAATMPGGFHVPSPGGRIDGGVSFGQYRRITR
jgi:hypothetical protein